MTSDSQGFTPVSKIQRTNLQFKAYKQLLYRQERKTTSTAIIYTSYGFILMSLRDEQVRERTKAHRFEREASLAYRSSGLGKFAGPPVVFIAHIISFM